MNDLQRSIVAGRNAARVGTRVEVLIDRAVERLDGTAQFEARMRSQAYEIDGQTYLSSSAIELAPGDLATATISGADDADLWAVAEARVRAARASAEAVEAEAVEAMGLGLGTVWGR